MTNTNLLAIKSNGKFSGNANDDIWPIEGLNNKSKPWISGNASPFIIVIGADANVLAFSSCTWRSRPAVTKLSCV